MTREEAKALIDALVSLRENATDEQALAAVALYPAWTAGKECLSGQRVRHGDLLYTVLQDHTAQADWTPDAAPSLFAKVLIPDSSVIPEWEQPDSTNPYKAGDKVMHNGSAWVSMVDNNVWEPGVYGWEVVE